MRLISLVLLFLLLCAQFAEAATRAEPAFRQIRFTAGFPWSEGLTLGIEPDERECKKMYGSRWQQKCAVSPGTPGHAAKGVRLEPAASGRWEWRTPSALVFIPADGESLRPGTLYRADVSALHLPGNISLASKNAEAFTPPLAARLTSSRFWLNPAPGAPHRLALTLDFSFPVPESAFNPALILPAGAQAGKPEIVWNHSHDRVSLSWPFYKLPDASGAAKIRLSGIKQIVQTENGLRFSNADAVFMQQLPARNSTFRIKSAKILTGKNEGLDSRYVLELETSLYTTASELARNMLLVELPKYRSAEALLPWDWSAAAGIDADALKKGRLLKCRSLQGENTRQSKFRFELPVRGGRHICVAIGKDLKSASGQPLNTPWLCALKAEPAGAQIGFLQHGNILAGAGELDLYGSDIDAIHWEAMRVREPFLALLAQTSGNPFAAPLENIDPGLESLAVIERGELKLAKRDEGKAQYASLDLMQPLKNTGATSGLVYLRLRGMRAGKEVATAGKLLLVSDLSLLVKRGPENALDCFVRNIGAARPEGGAKVSVLGANGKPVATATADVRGHASLPSLAGLSGEARPVAVIAEQGGNLAWLPLADRSRELDYSAFEAGGQHIDKNGIIAFVFSQRAIYRPGDTLFFGCISRNGDFSLLPANLPLFAELLDPAGRRLWSSTLKPGANGMTEIMWQSLPENISGRYVLNVKTGESGDIIGSTVVRLEAFQPETLKLKITPPTAKGWLVAGRDLLKAQFELQNLYGTPAKSHRLKLEAATSPAIFQPSGYENYTFTDPAPFLGDGASRNLGELETDQDGCASVILPEDLFGASARIAIMAQGFDAGGGRATAGSATFLISPSDRILGYRPLGALTNLEFINQDMPAQLEFIALDSGLATASWKNLEFTILRRCNITSLISDGSGGFRYDETPQELKVRSWGLDLPAAPAIVKLDTSTPGEFMLRVKSPEGAILAQIPYNVAGAGLRDGDAPLFAGKMRIRLDRERYDAGDEIQVSFASPYDASGLLAIEREKVEAFEWISVQAGDNLAKIRLPDSFEGRGYVTLTLARRLDSPVIYMNPLAYAVAPFNANLAARDMGLRLEAPAPALPGVPLQISVSAKKPGQALVYAVDEGILQLARWQDPAPLTALLGDRALDVATLQADDLLMPDHSRIASRLSAFGGGAELSPFGAKFQNPFKRRNEPPLVFWSGLVEVGEKPLQISIPVAPWQIGSVKIFAVGAGGDCAGAATDAVRLAAPLMLSANTPNALVPGDEFSGSLVLANNLPRQIKLDLRIDLPDSLELRQGLPANIAIPANSEIVLPFSAIALAKPGEAVLTFTASGDGVASTRQAFISIRPAGSLRTTIQAGVVTGDAVIACDRAVYPVLAQSLASLGGIPLPLAQSLGRYLETYPYGCTEQLISRAFGQILLYKFPEAALPTQERQKLLEAVNTAIAGRYDGQFVSLWPGGTGDLLLTCYAADYLLALREAGATGDASLLAQLCDAISWSWAPNEVTLSSARTSAYALWILAREGRVVTQQLETLVQTLDERGISGWQEDLTGAFIAAVKRELAMTADLDASAIRLDSDGWFDEFAQRSLLMTIMCRYFPARITPAFHSDFFDAAITALNSRNYATFSASQGIRALLAAAQAAAGDMRDVRLACLEPVNEGKGSLHGQILATETDVCAKYGIKGVKSPLFWQITTTGFDAQTPAAVSANGIEIARVYLNADGNPVTSARQGDEVRVRITARSAQGSLSDCVISDLLPGCMEMVIPRDNGRHQEAVKAIDRQEDRLLVFADLDDKPLELEYRVRIVTPGRFIVPPVSAEAMYQQAVYGVGASSVFEARQ